MLQDYWKKNVRKIDPWRKRKTEKKQLGIYWEFSDFLQIHKAKQEDSYLMPQRLKTWTPLVYLRVIKYFMVLTYNLDGNTWDGTKVMILGFMSVGTRKALQSHNRGWLLTIEYGNNSIIWQGRVQGRESDWLLCGKFMTKNMVLSTTKETDGNSVCCVDNSHTHVHAICMRYDVLKYYITVVSIISQWCNANINILSSYWKLDAKCSYALGLVEKVFYMAWWILLFLVLNDYWWVHPLEFVQLSKILLEIF